MIVLKKNGFHTKEYDEKSSEPSYVKLKGSIGFHLQSVIEIDKGVTVEDLMNEMIRHEADIDMMFFGLSKGYHIRPFYEEMKMVPTNKRKDLKYVELSWASDYYRSESKDRSNEVMLYIQMFGMAAKKHEDESLSYSLSSAPLNDWKHLEVRLSNMLFIYDFQVGKKDEDGNFGTKVVTMLEAEKEMTLYDFIGGFIDAITWHGYPEQRKERMDYIDSMINESHDVTSFNLEEKEYELKKAVEREEYELALVLKKQIDELKKKN